jgi:hypothetical protein
MKTLFKVTLIVTLFLVVGMTMKASAQQMINATSCTLTFTFTYSLPCGGGGSYQVAAGNTLDLGPHPPACPVNSWTVSDGVNTYGPYSSPFPPLFSVTLCGASYTLLLDTVHAHAY